MKTLRLLSVGLFSVLVIAVACTADDFSQTSSPASNSSASPGTAFGITEPGINGSTNRIAESVACNAYNIALESVTQVGTNYEWVWSVQNINPGNGNGGTTQDLSNWGMQFGACVAWSSVVGAAYSPNGVNWTSFTPTYEPNPSQTCMTGPVLKFDYGTTGSALSYYKVVVNQSYIQGYVPGYYKSGNKTGCCIFNFVGIGCPSVAEE